jgi:hypothetical protein
VAGFLRPNMALVFDPAAGVSGAHTAIGGGVIAITF